MNGGDLDYYRFSAKAGDRVFAAVVNSGSTGTSTDSQLTLLQSDGTTTVEADGDDGSQTAKASSIAGAQIPRDGAYYLRVSDLGAGLPPGEPKTEISYDLYLQLRSGAPTPEIEPNGSPGNATPIGAGYVSGTRNPAGEQDFYAMQLQAGDTVFLSLDLDPERDGTTYDGRLGLGPMGDADNQILIVNDPGASETPDPTIPSEALAMTVSKSGTYVAFVDSASSEVGGPAATYQLSATILPAEQASCRTYHSFFSGSVLDGGGITFPIPVEEPSRIGRAAVHLDLTQTVMADLDVSLRDPAGNELPLFTDIGSGSPGGQTHMDMVFDDYAAVPSAYTVVRPLMSQPDGARLDWLDGEQAEGEWAVVVRDDNPNSSGGNVQNAELILCAQPGEGVAKQIFHAGFQAGNEGFTHSGAADEWERGLPDTTATSTSPPVAGVSTCSEGSACFKTDLDGTYEPSSSQDLVSPPISLAGIGGPIEASWEQWYQLESASYDHVSVSVEESGGGDARDLFTWLGPTMTSFLGNPVVNGNHPAVAGWGLHRADISEYAGKTIRLRFHLDSDEIANFAGLAIDDVNVFVPGIPASPNEEANFETSQVVMPPPTSAAVVPAPGAQHGRTEVWGLGIRPTKFRAAASGAKAPGGATVTYAVPTPAAATLTVYKSGVGRKRGGVCKKAASPSAPGARCRLLTAIGSIKHTGPAGRVRMHFSGRIKGRPLQPGMYWLKVVAQSSGMDPSAALFAPFRILP